AGPPRACSTPNDPSAASRATSRCLSLSPPSTDTPIPPPQQASKTSVPPPRIRSRPPPKSKRIGTRSSPPAASHSCPIEGRLQRDLQQHRRRRLSDAIRRVQHTRTPTPAP